MKYKSLVFGLLFVVLIGVSYGVGKANTKPITTTKIVEITSSAPPNDCPRLEQLGELDTKLFANYQRYTETVLSILEYAYTLPEGDRFDGSGIFLTNQELRRFVRENYSLLEQREALVK